MPVFVGWLKWLSFLNYGFEVLFTNEMLGLTILIDPKGLPNIHFIPVEGRVILEQFDMDPSRFNLDLSVLCGMLVLYTTIAYLCLRFVIKERR